ncbi:transglutaminase domain-containing protein [Undibacterium sp. Ji83W]|uniref:transglutaminase domain-containing protein n=1 Tax=Undibacterium sp. Ji83W TaxID=3413043 RepID=UPI003BF1B133
MFRHIPLQRSVASIVLASFVSSLLSPLAMAQGTITAAPRVADSNNSVLLPLGPRKLPASKGMAVTMPTAQAANSKASLLAPAPVASNTSSTASADYARALTKLIDLSTQVSPQSLASNAAALTVITSLRSQYQVLQQQQQLLSKAFTATESFLTQNKLTGTVLQRHQSMVSEFTARAKLLQDAYAPLDSAAAGKGDATAALKQWQQAIKQYASQASALNGTKLPWGNSSDQVRKTTAAVTSTSASRQSPPPAFAPAPAVAAAGSLSGLALPDTVLSDAPAAADLAAAEEIQLTSEIQSLAASLQNNPVAIYNYVRNNIKYKVGYGSLQGAAQTLQAKSGNDIDAASLLIALNRAAGIPSRYVYGTVEIPTQRLLNWLHVDNVSAAQSLLSQAGVPNKAIIQGAQVTAIQVEHVWVEAYVDASPSRGARNNTASTWLPLDPSFKQLTSQSALNLRSSVSLNEAGVFDIAKQGANCTPDYGQSLNQANIQSAFTTYQNQLNQVLNQQGADLTIGSVLGSNVISAENYAILMGSLPYKTIVKSAAFQALPTNLKGAVRLQVFASSAAQAQGTATVSVNSSYAALAGKRLTLSFSPATQADADVLAAYLPKAHADNSPVTASEFPLSVPGYLIQVKAELRLDGQIVASGGSFTLGSELSASIGSYEPASGGWNDNNFSVHAGDYHAIVADTQGINPAQLNTVQQRLAATQAKLTSQPGSVSRDDLTGDLLHQTILAYFATTDANSAIFQHAAGVVEQRLPSLGRAVAQAIPDMTLGLVNSVSFPGVALDIDRLQTAVASQADGLSPAAYTHQSNQRNVAYAHMVLEKHYSQSQTPTAAASPIRVLAKAAALPQAQQQSVYAVTSSNLAAALLKLNLTNSQSIDVQNAVGAGYRVLVPQSPQTMSGWTGQAMQIEDIQTGAGAYRLSGNNGNTTAAILATQGMGWLMAEPALAAASSTPAINAAKAYDTVLASMLPGGGTDNTDSVRWSYFSGQADVASGLFLARLTGAQSNSTCDNLSSIIAANLGTTTAFDGDPGDIASVPVITSAPVTAAVAGLAYRYPVAAQDPKGASLSYSLTDAPSGMNISSTGVITWASPVLGSFNVTLRADNGKAFAEQRYLLTVSDHALALSISMAVAPALVNIGDKVTVTVLTNGGTGNISTSVTVDGQPQTLDAQGTATITATATGAHQVVATAKDDLTTVSKTSLYSVANPADTSLPTAQISTPTDDVEITAPTTIIGTATAQNLAYYQLLMRAAGTDKWQELARGYQNVSNGTLGKFDPTQLQNGIYELSVIAVNTNGVQASHMITLDVTRNLKIGQFSISFEDLNVQASGIPIRITRTYDTRRKGQALDFGQGWSVDYQNVQIRKNIILGLEWDVVTIPAQLTTCLRPRGKRKVDVTLPTGDVARFTAANERDCGVTVPPVKILFTALPGTTARLELVDVPALIQAQGGMLIDVAGAGESETTAWNPKYYKLTTEDNYEYYLTDGIGITKIKDPNGNVLTYSDSGVTHSNGTAATFTRDASHRITAVTDPAGKQIRYVYNATGDLISVTDRNGAVSKMTYDANHSLISYTDPNGKLAARFEYDQSGRLIARYDANGKAVQMQHDVDNNQQTVTDRRGNKTTYTYDSNGNITKVVNALNQVTTYTYDVNGNQATVTDPMGNITKSTYDPQTYKQLSETDPLGNINNWEYDLNAGVHLKSSTDAKGARTVYYYGSNGTTATNALGGYTNRVKDDSGNVINFNLSGQVTRYQSDIKGNRISETDAAGKVSTYVYDSNGKEISRSWIATVMVNGVPTQKTVSVTRTLDAEGRVISETDALGATTKTEYTPGGNVSATTDPQGRRTTYSYDDTGRLATTTYPDGKTTTTVYDASGNKISDTDRQGRATRYEYDALNRLVRTTAADGTSISTTYDDAGRVTSMTDAQGNSVTKNYDSAGRLITLTDARSKQTHYEYDGVGNRTKIVDATGKVTQFEYDILSRSTKTTYSDNSASNTIWNLIGTKQSEIDQAGNTTQYGYDPVGRLNQVTQTNAATQQQTIYGYDVNGNKTSQIDAQSHVTSWTYDANNRVASRTLPAGQTESFAYDVAGNLIQKTDFAGKVTSYIYDVLGQVVQTNYPDGSSVSTTYTAAGQVASSTTSGGNNSNGRQNGQTIYTYDANDRITKQVKPDGSYLSYAYDANGNIKQRSTAVGTVSYGYDKNQRLINVTNSTTNSNTTYTWDDAGRLATAMTPDGVTASYSYDQNGRLLQLLHVKGSNVIAGSRYTLAANGQRTKVEEFDTQSTQVSLLAANPVRTTSYQYDGVNRLTQELVKDRSNTTVRTTDYQYDKVGNRSQKTEATASGTTTTTYTYDANDRLTLETKTTGANNVVTTYTWDDKGNLSTKTTGGQVTVYGWNADNRLVEVKQGSSQESAVIVARYSYDSNGNRVLKVEPGQNTSPDKVTSYLIDDTFNYAQTVQEIVTQGTASESASYVWGNGLIQQSRVGQSYFYRADALGSIKALTDAQGNITDTYQYDVFGNLLDKSGTTTNQYRYTGEYFDDAISLQYNRSRWYDELSGRFMSQDRFPGFDIRPVSFNKYVYANSNPAKFTDSSGLTVDEAQFGRDVEGEVQKQYDQDHSMNRVIYGRVWRYSDTDFYKPDIQDLTLEKYQEIKPLTPSGIVAGIAQMDAYDIAFGIKSAFGILSGSNWQRGDWNPPRQPVTVGGIRPVFFITVGGIIFYTDDKQLAMEASMFPLAKLNWFVKNNAMWQQSSLNENAIYGAYNSWVSNSAGIGQLATSLLAVMIGVATISKR